MTNEAIQSILDRLNNGTAKDVIINKIGRAVWWGVVWGETDQGYEPIGHIQTKGDEFFFVQARDGKFAAAVHRSGSDELHWYVAEVYRGKGVLVQPLKKAILPFIFKIHEDCKEQEASVEDGPYSKQSMKLAQKIGFRCISYEDRKRKLVFKREQARLFSAKICVGLNESELRNLERDVDKLFRSLRRIEDTLRIKHFGPFANDFPAAFEGAEVSMLDLQDVVFTAREKVTWSRRKG